jgi:hypothetical protein
VQAGWSCSPPIPASGVSIIWINQDG